MVDRRPTDRPSLQGIYALVEPERHAEPLAYLGALLTGGIRLFQMRAKRGLDLSLLQAACGIVHAAGGLVIVNDDLELALAADGVHLGPEDLLGRDPVAIRRQLGDRLVGLSCGTPAEARELAPGLADYLGVGPIFATRSKADAGGPIGINGVRVVVAATALPVAAIGGISLATLARVRETGATMAAVISALADPPDPAATARAFVQAWER